MEEIKQSIKLLNDKRDELEYNIKTEKQNKLECDSKQLEATNK